VRERFTARKPNRNLREGIQAIAITTIIIIISIIPIIIAIPSTSISTMFFS